MEYGILKLDHVCWSWTNLSVEAKALANGVILFLLQRWQLLTENELVCQIWPGVKSMM